MNTPKKSNIDWIDIAKGTCILLVVFHHIISTNYMVPLDSVGNLESIVRKIYLHIGHYFTPLRMPLFFMISGFLAQRSAKNASWSSIWHKRINNIWYLYLLWSVIQCISVAVIGFLTYREIAHPITNAIYSENFSQFFTLTLSGRSSLWYLYALPIYFILCKAFSNQKLIIITIALLLNLTIRAFPIVWPIDSIIANAIYYITGCFILPNLLPLLETQSKKILSYTIASIAVILVINLFGINIDVLNSLAMTAAFMLFFDYISTKGDFTILKWLGKNTLQIYVLHRILLEYVNVFVTTHMFTPHNHQLTLWQQVLYITFPIIGTLLVAFITLFIWKITNVGIGKYLYKAPEIITDKLRSVRESK